MGERRDRKERAKGEGVEMGGNREDLTSKHVPKHQCLEEGRIVPPQGPGSVTPKSPECQRSSP